MSNTNPLRATHRFTDATGRCCTRVPLANSPLYAVLLTEDFERLTAAGLTRNWGLNRNKSEGQAYVCAKVTGANTISVSRLVTGAGRRQIVRYGNGDRLDLRAENLYVSKGGTARKDCSAILQQEDANEVTA